MPNAQHATGERERLCGTCGADEVSSQVSFYPCPFCRTTYYCSPRHHVEGAALHDCPKTISAQSSFSRNCFLLFSQRKEPLRTQLLVNRMEDDERKRLLHHAYDRKVAAGERMDAIHAQIATWNPDMAKIFEKKAVAFSDAPLRVLNSRWELVELGDFAAEPSFVALSYCWRSQDWKPVADSYHPDGADIDIPIAGCLWDFLLDLLDSHEEAIWVDQICIDQMNDLERRSAVASMDVLYSAARLVFVAIEDIVLTAEEVSVLEEGFRQVSSDPGWTLSSEKANRLFAVVGKIFSARWFHRAWCFHEYHTGTERLLAIPREDPSSPGSLSAIGISNLGEFILRLAYFQNEDVRDRHAELIKQLLEFFGAQDGAFSNIIANTFQYGSKDPEDKVSIALNICQLDFKLPPDILASPEARIYVLVLALAAGDATILTTRGPKVQYGQDLENTSWLNWPNETSWSARHPFPLPRGITSVSIDHVVMDLLFIPHGTVVSPSAYALRRASALLRSTWVRRIRLAYNLQGDGEEQAEEQGTLETLACAFDCGRKWMAAAWRRIKGEVSAEVDESFEAVEYLQDIVLGLAFSRPRSNLAKDGGRRVRSKIWLIRGTSRPTYRVFGRSRGSQRVRIVRPEHQEASATYRMIICVLLFGRYWEFGTWVHLGPRGQKAVSDLHSEKTMFRVPIPSEHKLYSGADYSHHAKATTILAVPRPLAGRRFGMSDRLWLMQNVAAEHADRDGPRCWRVIEKVCLLGCGTIKRRPGYVHLVKREKVVG